MAEFTNAVNSKTKDTSPGFYNVTYSMLRYLPQSALKTILILFNNIWNYETVIPFSWKHIKIIAIHCKTIQKQSRGDILQAYTLDYLYSTNI